MTRRKPLEWYDTGHGTVPFCDTCMELLSSPGFMEAVYSVSIEHPGDPADLAKRTLDRYHANRHQD